jgi:hypothetical protein
VELNIAFSKLTKSDGSVAEDLDIAIGKSITSNPINFLKAYKKHKESVTRLDALVGNLGPGFVDDFPRQATEIRKRIKALAAINDSLLKPVASECIEALKKHLQVVSTSPHSSDHCTIIKAKLSLRRG